MTCMGTNASNDKSMIDNSSVNVADLYPNPASDNLTINFVADVDKDIVIEIFNTLGSRVSAQKYAATSGENILSTNVAEYTNGIYFVHITDLSTKTVLNKKFIKQ